MKTCLPILFLLGNFKDDFKDGSIDEKLEGYVGNNNGSEERFVGCF